MQIDKNVPIPGRGVKRTTIPIFDMEIGDSVFVECDKSDTHKVQRKISASTLLRLKKKGLNWKFCVRKVDNGIRIWRVQ